MASIGVSYRTTDRWRRTSIGLQRHRNGRLLTADG
jgi:hypothetical protein